VIARPVLLLVCLVCGQAMAEELSDASRRVAAGLTGPLTIHAFFSGAPPEFRALEQQVLELLDEYGALDGIDVRRHDPYLGGEAERLADKYGVEPTTLRIFKIRSAEAHRYYGTIVLVCGDRPPEVMNVATRFADEREGLEDLEYDITSRVWRLSRGKPAIAICGHLGPRRFEGLEKLLARSFEVGVVDLKTSRPESKLLLVIRPREFTGTEVLHLDQYLMGGGRVLMFLTQGEIEEGPAPAGSLQRGEFRYTPFETGLDRWLAHHGLRVPNEFVLHLRNAPEIPVVQVREVVREKVTGPFPEANWFWPTFGLEGAFDEDNPAMGLRTVTLFWPHPVDVVRDRLGGKKATVLVRSHKEESWRWKDVQRIDRRTLDPKTDGPDPAELCSSPVAVALEGRFTSFFAGRADVVKQSTESTHLVVVGNSFFVSDLLLGGSTDERSRTDAARLALNLVDWLMLPPDLMSLRGK
jgi:hypothetical protein